MDVLLRGAVMYADDKVRISMSLIEPASDFLLWSDNYEGVLAGLFELQADVTTDIVREVELKLTEQDQQRLARQDTPNEKARVAYYKGINTLRAARKEELDRAVAFFDEAIALDPEFAPAYVGKARAYLSRMSANMSPQNFMPAARDAAQRALEIDDTLASAWVVLGFVRLQYEWDWEGAREAFQTAINLEPELGEAYTGMATFYVTIGDSDRAVAYLREAVRIDPTTLLLYDNSHYVPFMAGQARRARRLLRRELRMPVRDRHRVHRARRSGHAVQYLQRAVVARSECMPFLGTDPRLDPLRSDPDFQQVMRDVDHPMIGRPVPE